MWLFFSWKMNTKILIMFLLSLFALVNNSMAESVATNEVDVKSFSQMPFHQSYQSKLDEMNRSLEKIDEDKTKIIEKINEIHSTYKAREEARLKLVGTWNKTSESERSILQKKYDDLEKPSSILNDSLINRYGKISKNLIFLLENFLVNNKKDKFDIQVDQKSIDELFSNYKKMPYGDWSYLNWTIDPGCGLVKGKISESCVRKGIEECALHEFSSNEKKLIHKYVSDSLEVETQEINITTNYISTMYLRLHTDDNPFDDSALTQFQSELFRDYCGVIAEEGYSYNQKTIPPFYMTVTKDGIPKINPDKVQQPFQKKNPWLSMFLSNFKRDKDENLKKTNYDKNFEPQKYKYLKHWTFSEVCLGLTDDHLEKVNKLLSQIGEESIKEFSSDFGILDALWKAKFYCQMRVDEACEHYQTAEGSKGILHYCTKNGSDRAVTVDDIETDAIEFRNSGATEADIIGHKDLKEIIEYCDSSIKAGYILRNYKSLNINDCKTTKIKEKKANHKKAK